MQARQHRFNQPVVFRFAVGCFEHHRLSTLQNLLLIVQSIEFFDLHNRLHSLMMTQVPAVSETHFASDITNPENSPKRRNGL